MATDLRDEYKRTGLTVTERTRLTENLRQRLNPDAIPLWPELLWGPPGEAEYIEAVLNGD